MKNPLKYSRFQAALQVLMLLASTIAIRSASAQSPESVPIVVAHRRIAGTNQVDVSWSSVPGRSYQLVTRDGLESPWTATNVPPIKARSTRVTITNAVDDPDVPVRFYRVLAPPV